MQRAQVPGPAAASVGAASSRWRRGGLVALAVLAAACSGASARSSDARSTTTTTAPTTTATTNPATLPCGGPPAVAAAVKVSPVAGLNVNATQYRVGNVTTAESDPTWGRFDTLPQSGQEGTYQGGSGLVHCAAGVWTVTDFGTAEVGCPGGQAAPPPAAVAADLGIDCP